jgi:hypothetical protein
MSEVKKMKAEDIASRDLSGLDLEILKSSNQYRQTIQASRDSLAVEVAELAEVRGATFVVVLDERNIVYGVLDLPWMLRRIREERGQDFSRLSDAFVAISQDPDEIARDFHHEWLLDHRPELHLCPAGHYTTDNPCPDHEN